MSFDKVESEVHKRRSGLNRGVGLVLVAFVALVFGLTVVKVTRGDMEPEHIQLQRQAEG